MFENWNSMEMGFLKAIAYDLLNIFIMVGGYKLAKFAKRKQTAFFANGGSSDVSWGDTFVWGMSLVMGLIAAWCFPVIFHEKLCYLTGFDYRIGMLAKLAQLVLVVQMIYIAFKCGKVMLPVGRVVLMVVLPICLVYGHYYSD